MPAAHNQASAIDASLIEGLPHAPVVIPQQAPVHHKVQGAILQGGPRLRAVSDNAHRGGATGDGLKQVHWHKVASNGLHHSVVPAAPVVAQARQGVAAIGVTHPGPATGKARPSVIARKHLLAHAVCKGDGPNGPLHLHSAAVGVQAHLGHSPVCKHLHHLPHCWASASLRELHRASCHLEGGGAIGPEDVGPRDLGVGASAVVAVAASGGVPPLKGEGEGLAIEAGQQASGGIEGQGHQAIGEGDVSEGRRSRGSRRCWRCTGLQQHHAQPHGRHSWQGKGQPHHGPWQGHAIVASAQGQVVWGEGQGLAAQHSASGHVSHCEGAAAARGNGDAHSVLRQGGALLVVQRQRQAPAWGLSGRADGGIGQVAGHKGGGRVPSEAGQGLGDEGVRAQAPPRQAQGIVIGHVLLGGAAHAIVVLRHPHGALQQVEGVAGLHGGGGGCEGLQLLGHLKSGGGVPDVALEGWAGAKVATPEAMGVVCVGEDVLSAPGEGRAGNFCSSVDGRGGVHGIVLAAAPGTRRGCVVNQLVHVTIPSETVLSREVCGHLNHDVAATRELHCTVNKCVKGSNALWHIVIL